MKAKLLRAWMTFAGVSAAVLAVVPVGCGWAID